MPTNSPRRTPHHFMRRLAQKRPGPRTLLTVILAVSSLVAVASTTRARVFAGELSTAEARLADSVKYLSADEMEGRGIGTKGIDLAADYIAKQFADLGLKTTLYDGGPFQKFTLTIGAELGATNQAAFVGPPAADAPEGQKLALAMGQDFTPLASGGSGVFDLPLAFVGYGITGKDENYDDYAGIDVAGKAVIVLRKEPQQDNPHSVFDGTKHSQYAPFSRKLANAYEHGAAAVIFVNDDYGIEQNIAGRRAAWQEAIDKLVAEDLRFKEVKEPTREQLEEHRKLVEDLAGQIRGLGDQIKAEYDPLLGFQAAGPESGGRNFPVLAMRREAVDRLLRAAGKSDLATLEAQIDHGPTPASFDIPDWKLVGEVTVIRKEAEVKNVLAVLEGEGPLADETVVVGAHYDHLGTGGEGSLMPGSTEIHNGADDNASGSAALIEVARRLVEMPTKPRRRIVFMAFTGEERGLLGSSHQVKDPLIPAEKIVAMLNMDMVGRLNENKLIIQGVDTSPEFGPLVDRLNEQYEFEITRQSGGFGPSDHASFYALKVPVMHFFTGTHADYHRPSDDFDKLNIGGMALVGAMVADAAAEIANADARPQYVEVKSSATLGGGGDRPYFGSIPDFSQTEPGYALTGVTKDGPAEKAGIQAGDIVIKLGESRIGNLEDFDSALRKYKAGDKVPVVVKRGEAEVTVEVTLDPPR